MFSCRTGSSSSGEVGINMELATLRFGTWWVRTTRLRAEPPPDNCRGPQFHFNTP